LAGNTPAIADDALTEIIAQADRIIDGKLAIADLTGSGTTIEAASLEYARAGVLTHRRDVGTQPGSLRIHKSEAEVQDLNKAIKAHMDEGDKLVDQFIAENQTSPEDAHVYVVNK
jgi:ATP phosphoribosyltransferase